MTVQLGKMGILPVNQVSFFLFPRIVMHRTTQLLVLITHTISTANIGVPGIVYPTTNASSSGKHSMIAIMKI